MLPKPFLDLGYIKGLIYRRLKWHKGEYENLGARWDRLEDKETAQRAVNEHWGAMKELRALIDMREPPPHWQEALAREAGHE